MDTFVSPKQILVDMGDKTTYFTDLQFLRKYYEDSPLFFYVYLAEWLWKSRDDLIKELIERAV